MPKFQRGYSWQAEHINEYWSDISRAREKNVDYFMGTVVLAEDHDTAGRMLIVDGQQRITTTAILLIAVRDRLHTFGLDEQWRAVQREYLADYVLAQESHKAKLTLSPTDAEAFDDLLNIETDQCRTGFVLDAYKLLKSLVEEVAPTKAAYSGLIDLVSYLSSSVQVLIATANDLSEAFVIFETLNDRGADLTTADLLKNFLFSQAGANNIRAVEEAWVRISGSFPKSTDFVRFIRHEHMSRKGHVTLRGLYKAVQSDISSREGGVLRYLSNLEDALKIYQALKEPDDQSWSANAIGVRDSLLAFRRLGLEMNSPLLLAAFERWSVTDASRLVNIVANWSVRAWAAGTLGGGTAESAFSRAAVAVTEGEATKPDDLWAFMRGVVPEDSSFRVVFSDLGPVNTTIGKYLLGQLERQARLDAGENVDAVPDWSSRSVTVEHIMKKSSKTTDFDTVEQFKEFEVIRDRIQNLAPLEQALNAEAKDAAFPDKRHLYQQSSFRLTASLGEEPEWSFERSAQRNEELADLAVRAWPLRASDV